jgi:UDP-N-acetylmuramate dehydrogenase
LKAEVRNPIELTTIGVGAPRKVYVPENLLELRSLLKEGLRVVGGGSNTVLSEEGVPLVSLEKFRDVTLSGDLLRLGAGVKLSCVLRLQRKNKFSLFEFLSGVPRATVGGLVAQNAGAFGREIKDFLYSVEYLDIESGEVLRLNREEILNSFKYRSSPFPEGGVVVSATFKVVPDDNISEKIKRIVNLRLKKHPPFYLKTAGSTFKNPSGFSAGKLLDECGFRGFKLKNLKFSEVHANFLINEGGAPFSEFLEIVEIAREKVKDQKGVDLKLEVRVV